MKRMIVAMTATLLGVASFQAQAQNPQSPAATVDPVTALIQSEIEDVTNIKKDPVTHGIKSLVVIGRAPLSRSLTKAKAKQVAMKAAGSAARAHFVKFLDTRVSYKKDSSSGSIIVQEGASAGDKGEAVSQEHAKTVDVSADEQHEFAESAVSGLRQIGAGVFDGSAVVVLGWDMETAKDAQTVKGAMNAGARKLDQEAAGGSMAVTPKPSTTTVVTPQQTSPQPVTNPTDRVGTGANEAPAPRASSTGEAADFF